MNQNILCGIMVTMEDKRKQAPGNQAMVAVYIVGYSTLVTIGIVASIAETIAYTFPNSSLETIFENIDRVVTEMVGVEMPTTAARYSIHGAEANVVIRVPANLAAEPAITSTKSLR